MCAISIDRWEAIVAPHFSFLEERFHWSVVAREDASNWETTVTYARDPCAVIVRYSVEFQRAEVELVRLVDGNVPPVPVFVHPSTRIDRSLIDNLLALRAPSKLAELRRFAGLDEPSMHQALALQADALERYAIEFLWLDLGVFDEFDLLIKARVSGANQRIRIAVPEGTGQEEIDRTVAQAKRLDPEVPVEVAFYKRPPPAKRRLRLPWRR